MTQMQKRMPGGYGAFEMKVRYRQNMLTGTMFSALLAVSVMAGFFLFPGETEEAVIEVRPPRSDSTIIVIDLDGFRIESERPPVSGPRRRLKDKPGTWIIPVEDEPIDYNPVVTSYNGSYTGGEWEGDGGNGDDFGWPGFVDVGWGGEYPEPEEFVSVEMMPQMIYECTPDYPRLAAMAGWECFLWVKALVDIDGTVRETFILKSDCPEAGFEKAALAAAAKCRYKPAVQNGYPVPVWVAYKVEFVLDKDK